VEAHPTDVWQTQSNIKENVLFRTPKNEEERAFVAGACVRKLGVKFPAVLDEFENPTEQAYTAWPDRIYLVDRNRRVVYKSKPGPFGFKPDQLATALASLRNIGQSSVLLRQQTTPPATGGAHRP
jgi:type I thyroxine 5'-deiodinase